MKKFGLKTFTWYAVIGLVVALAFLPILKSMAPQIFPVEGFRNDTSCRDAGMTCPEGSFCQEKSCIPIATRYPNNVPSGDL
jgi:hypothetical protein